jgi:predicted sulfurtransferase
MTDSTGSTAHDSGPVFRLIYRSHSRIPLDQRRTELGNIFTTARRNNRDRGVTGALVLAEDGFVQALEGDEAAVRDLYAQITRDPRHDQCSVLEEQTIDGRTFGRWAMAKVAADDGPDIRLMSNAQKGVIVLAPGQDHSITDDQETVLAFMRTALTTVQ